MSDIIKWGDGSDRFGRDQKKDVQRIIKDARIEAFKMEADAAKIGRAMELATDLDNYRHQLAAGNPELNAALVRLELVFLTNTERRLRSSGSPFGF